MESIQFFVRFHLGAVAHPVLCVDTLAQCHLQVLHQFHHTFLGCSREVFFHVHFAYQLTQHTVYRTYGTFPARLIYLTTRQYLAIEIETGSHEVIAQARSGCIEQIVFQVRHVF